MFGFSLDNEHVFGNHGRMVRTGVRRRRRVLLCSAAALVVTVVGHGAQALGPPQRAADLVGGHSYVVQPGDSLWSIAVRSGSGRDPRMVVARIEDANRLDDVYIVPGQALLIPSGA
jgi:hypothetical protein